VIGSRFSGLEVFVFSSILVMRAIDNVDAGEKWIKLPVNLSRMEVNNETWLILPSLIEIVLIVQSSARSLTPGRYTEADQGD
jgi:hypothetical protein